MMRSRIDPLCIIILLFIPFTIIISKGVTCEKYLYYETNVSHMEKAKSFWLELDNNNSTVMSSISIDLYRTYDQHLDRVQNLSFDFPFYGHPIHSLRVDWSGYIATPDYHGKFLDPHTITLFIAPHDSFNLFLNQKVTVRCFSNGSQLTVTWEMTMMEYASYLSCMFQTTLYNTGHIVFVFKFCDWPIYPIGISDVYMMDNGTSRRYDRLIGPKITNYGTGRWNWTSIYFTPRHTCLNHKDCSSCLSDPSTSHLTCYWCPTANLCSTGEDWYHPVWSKNNCEAVKKSQSYPGSTTIIITTTTPTPTTAPTSTPRLRPTPTTTTTTTTTKMSAPPTQHTLDTTLVVIVCSALFLLIGCIGILVLLVRRMKPSDTLIETNRAQPADLVAETTVVETTAEAEAVHTTHTQPVMTAEVTQTQAVQVVQMTQWTKRVIITIEAQTTPGSEDSFMMPIVKIEKQKTTTNQLDSADMNMAEYAITPNNKWEFSRQSLSLGETLGEGAFGRVIRAEANGIMKPGTVTTVAVKMLKEDHLDSEMIALVSEMELMKMIGRHVNILNLLGVCSQHGPLYVIVEFAQHNDLKHFLRKHRPYSNVVFSDSNQVNLSEEVLVSFAHQVATGMKYLHSKKCLHRDLAARNVLVCHNYILKIADFGLARDVQVKEYYRVDSQPLLPYKWMAPESLSHHLFKYESDVWSYGVLLWEIMTFGGAPYPSICDSKTMLSFLRSGHRLEKPSHCSDEMYIMMQECWKDEANDRPLFSQLVSKLDNKLTNK